MPLEVTPVYFKLQRYQAPTLAPATTMPPDQPMGAPAPTATPGSSQQTPAPPSAAQPVPGDAAQQQTMAPQLR